MKTISLKFIILFGLVFEVLHLSAQTNQQNFDKIKELNSKILDEIRKIRTSQNELLDTMKIQRLKIDTLKKRVDSLITSLGGKKVTVSNGTESIFGSIKFRHHNDVYLYLNGERIFDLLDPNSSRSNSRATIGSYNNPPARLKIDSVQIKVKDSQLTRVILFYNNSMNIYSEMNKLDSINSIRKLIAINYNQNNVTLRLADVLQYIPLNNDAGLTHSFVTTLKAEKEKDLIILYKKDIP